MKTKIFFILLLLIIFNVYKTSNEELIIPDTAIRLRVIPNSNEPLDINIKEQVKSYLEKDIYTLLKNTTNIETARDIIEESIPSIDKNVNYILKENNYKLPYKINFGYNLFPEKIYQGQVYPEGEYESLVITLGNGSGDNWWCVLFPNFCLADTTNDIEYKSYLYELIDKIF